MEQSEESSTVHMMDLDGVPLYLVHNAGDPGKSFVDSYANDGVERVFADVLESFEPDIVHFSGHGSDASEIILQDEDGNAVLVEPEALSNLFGLLVDNTIVMHARRPFSGKRKVVASLAEMQTQSFVVTSTSP